MPKYIYQEKAIKAKGEKVVHPKFAKIRNLSTDELIEHVAHGSPDKKREMTMALMLLQQELPHLLAGGNSISLEGIGILTPTLKMRENRKVTTSDEEGTEHKSNALSVEFGTVRFKPSKELLKRCHAECTHLEHDTLSGDSKVKTQESTFEERKSKLQDYLKEAPAITTKQYMELTGISKSSANRELTRMCDPAETEDAILTRSGRAPHVIYFKKG